MPMLSSLDVTLKKSSTNCTTANGSSPTLMISMWCEVQIESDPRTTLVQLQLLHHSLTSVHLGKHEIWNRGGAFSPACRVSANQTRKIKPRAGRTRSHNLGVPVGTQRLCKQTCRTKRVEERSFWSGSLSKTESQIVIQSDTPNSKANSVITKERETPPTSLATCRGYDSQLVPNHRPP